MEENIEFKEDNSLLYSFWIELKDCNTGQVPVQPVDNVFLFLKMVELFELISNSSKFYPSKKCLRYFEKRHTEPCIFVLKAL